MGNTIEIDYNAHVRRLILCGISCLGLLTPSFAGAASTHTWDFTGSAIPGQWDVAGLQPTPSTIGLVLRAPETGFMSREADIPHGVDTITLTYVTPFATEAKLLFSHPDYEGAMLELPFVLDAAPDMNVMSIPVSTFDQWQRDVGTIGFAFPAGVQLTLMNAGFIGYNPIEKATQAFKSFWTLDNFRGTSVNFLWGPQLTFTPLAREVMFQSLPPRSTSAMTALYIIIAMCGAYGLLRRYRGAATRDAWKPVLLTFVAVWLLLDVRMGIELLSYATDDIRTYWSQPVGMRELRVRRHFNDFAEQITPLITDENYAFIGKYQKPYISIMRYMTYPDLPTGTDDVHDGLRQWVIFERPDIVVDDENRLTYENRILSKPGRIVHRHGPGTFFFVTES